MISIAVLGELGRLGNSLFQYAFLRSTAIRLKATFYCPPWAGDKIFDLDDDSARSKERCPTDLTPFVELADECGYSSRSCSIEDGVEIRGYFQSERFFISPEQVRSWYRFKEGPFVEARKRWAGLDLDRSVCLHLRFGDYISDLRRYVPRKSFYQRAANVLGTDLKYVLFSDDPQTAYKYLKNCVPNLTVVSGNSSSEDLYLMSRCQHFVISASTFAWWGAWLGTSPVKRVFVPREGHMRPGAAIKATDFWPASWTQLPGLYPWDTLFVRRVIRKLDSVYSIIWRLSE